MFERKEKLDEYYNGRARCQGESWTGAGFALSSCKTLRTNWRGYTRHLTKASLPQFPHDAVGRIPAPVRGLIRDTTGLERHFTPGR